MSIFKRSLCWSWPITLLLLATTLPSGAQNPQITEFLAANDSILADEDSEYSDWIELYNPSATPVNLGGWYLTDNAGHLTKWMFPNTNLAAYSYLVVFASGKDRTNAGAPLHTNFRLEASGELLALMKPDGETPASFYAPRFPSQNPDISYGRPMIPGPSTFLIDTGMPARVLIPANDIGSAWTGAVFEDGAWLSGVLGVGFDGSTNYQSVLNTDLQAPMLGVNASAYIRVPFQVTDPAEFQELKLRMRYDDGFVAYLNGTEVARKNAPATNLSWNSAATVAHGSDTGIGGTLKADFDTVTNAYTPSTQGAATGPSIQNTNTGSTGRFFRLLTDAVNGQNNSIAFTQTVAGLFPVINAQFDFRMTSADAPADGFAFMLIPTSTYGTTGVGINPVGAVEEPNFPNVFAVGFDMYPHASQNDVSVHWDGGEIQNTTIPISTIDLVSGQFHRCQLTLVFGTDGARATVTIFPNVNIGGGTSFVAINNVLLPGMPQYECRVQLAGRTGGLDMNVDLDNIDVQFGSPQGLVPDEEFNVSQALPLLQAGQNVLAIQGLNLAPTNADFLISPQLLARQVTLITTSAVFQAQATPGSMNVPGDEFLAPPVEFSIPGGVFTNDFISVALTSPISNAVIHYTLNGTTPTEQSTTYTNTPIQTSNSVRIVAIAWALGYVPSKPVSEGYTLLDRNALSFSSGLPLVIVDTFNATIITDMNPKAPATITIIDTALPAGRATLMGIPDVHRRIGIEGRGQTSWGFNKKPFNIEFVDDYDRGQNASFLNFPDGSDFVLLSVWNDKTFLNDYLAYALHEEMGHYSMRRRFVEVFFNGTYPGSQSGTAPSPGKVGTNDYAGIYLLLEKPRIDADRIDIAKLQPEDNTEPNITGGYVWKKDKNSPGDVNFALPNQPINAGMKFHDPRPEQLTSTQRVWLVNYLTEFENVLYGQNWRDPIDGYTKYVDVDSFVDAHWIVEFPKQIDGYRLSNYMYKDRGGKINMEPVWDWNLSFGNANYLEGGLTNGWYYPLISEQEHIWLRRIMTGSSSGSSRPGDPEFLQKIADRWGELRTSVFNVDKLIAQVENMTNYLYAAALRDLARFPRLGTYLWPNPDGPNLSSADGTTAIWDVNFATTTTYDAVIGELKKWIRGRYVWVDRQFLIAPIFSRYSGLPSAPLNIYATAGTVYYTLDGSDPRLPGGTISPVAQVYTNSITLPANARVVARGYSTATNLWIQWSPATRASFGDPVPRLAITEIMYHPEPDPDGDYEDEDFEYIELTNTGTEALDLTGMHLGGGIDFTFPAGPLEAAGTPTTNNFDAAGTPYTASTLGAGPGAVLTAGGPQGSYIRLATQGTGTNRNRIAFDQTATGPYDLVTADFDFRANNATAPPSPDDAPTLQDFDTMVTNYVLRSYDTAGDPATPLIAGPDAGSTGKYVRLTRETGNEQGGIFFDATAARTNRQVVIHFDFRMQAAGTPADGLGFVYLNTANHSTNGATASGWNGEDANMPGSLGVSFDNYFNSPATANEPNDNHVSLHWNGAQVAGAQVTPSFRMVNTGFHRATIILKFDGTRALVTVKLTPNVNGAAGPTETLFNDYVITSVTPYRGRAGICARTGGAWANQEIDNLNMQYFGQLLPPAGGLSMVLLPSATFGTAGAGTGTNNYLDAPNLTNAFALDLGMHSSPVINDVTLHWDGAARGSAFIPPATLDLDSGTFHHARIEVTRGDQGSLVTLRLTPDVFGTPGTPVTVLSDAFVSGFYPGSARVEFAGRSGAMNLGIDVENVLVTYATNAPNLLAVGARILLVSSNAAFQARYGTNLPVAGQYSGRLNNAGDHLILYGRYGEPILDFSYNDAWYPITDGNGFALVFPNPQLGSSAWTNAANWQVGNVPGGSPGQANPPPPTFAPVLITEVLSHPDAEQTDAIELHNPSGTPADVGHWYLSDNFDVPKKYLIPEGTSIPPGGYLAIYASAFNPTNLPLSTNRFALRAEGDDVYIFSANAGGDLTGYYHGLDFGAAEAGVSFGRYVTSIGEEHAVAQAALTLGTNNAGPKIGPLVISEVMYRPPDYAGGIDNSEDEFIELHNPTATEVKLFDETHPTNTWRLRDAVDFEFPVNTVIPAHGFLLVVNFDPAMEPSQLAAFRAKYNVDPLVLILGPYGGKLDNSGESVELTKPSAPDPDTLQPDFILVDKVKYTDELPWPGAADGLGLSLQRIDVNAYGNDPANWLAAQPTAGRARTGSLPPQIAAQPQSLAVAEMAPASFSVGMSGAGSFTYQWRWNGSALPGATAATLLLSSVQASDAGEYSVVVFSGGTAVVSSNAILTVYPAPVILTQPLSVTTTNAGSNVTFTVVAIGNGPLSYQWQRYGQNLAGATGASYTVTNAQFNVNDGTYTVVVTDALGSRVSQPAYLSTKTKPGITQNLKVTPANSNVLEGRTFTLSISATGSFPMGFRFRLASASITNLVFYSNANTAVLVVDNAKSNLHAGVWDVAITNSGGNAPISAKVTLTVTPAKPYFALNPIGQTNVAGATVLLTSEARGTDPIRYQWYFNATNALADATNASLTLSNIPPASAGDYVVVATNRLGSATSEVAQVTIQTGPAGPSITTQPANQTTTVCSNAVFSVSASGESLSYQWWFNATNALAGETGLTLTIAVPRPALAGDYTVVISNPGGSATSEVATLTVVVVGDQDGDGMSDAWELANSLDPCSPDDRNHDADTDGRTNWEEFTSGTDPRNASSVLKVSLANGGNGSALIQFTAMPGIGYSVLHRNNPATGSWLILTNIEPLLGTNAMQVVDPDAGAAGNRFYRIATPMQQP